MEALAFVELIDRHNDVLARHAVYRWPARLGRGYQSDIIIDDPYIAATHVEIRPGQDSRFTVVDLGSMNGIFVGPSESRVDRADLGPDDLLGLGQTHIRIRATSHSVQPERRLHALSFYRRPEVFAAFAAVTFALFLWNAWIMTGFADADRYAFIFPALIVTGGVAVWIALWSFVSSAVARTPHFAAHGSVACAGIIAILASDSFFDYAAFGFDTGWLQQAGTAASAALLAYVVYRHLVINSRARRTNLALVSTTIALALAAVAIVLTFAVDVAQDGKQQYNQSIKAPAFLFVSGESPESFIADAAVLKRKVDAMAKKD